MYRTLRTALPRSPAGPWGHAPSTHLAFTRPNPDHVAVLGKHLGLEPAHGVGAGGRSQDDLAVQRDPHRRAWASRSAVGILVAARLYTDCLRRPTNRCCTLRPPRLSCRHSFAVSVSPSASSNSRQASSPASEVMVAPRNSNRTRRSKRSVAFGHPLGASEDSTLSTAKAVAREV